MHRIPEWDKSGRLDIKDKIEILEYHLYDKSVPVSYDLNAKLREYLFDEIDRPIYINIINKNINIILFGKLHSKIEDGMEKFYINEYDLEEILFDNTGLKTNIKIKVEEGNETEGSSQ